MAPSRAIYPSNASSSSQSGYFPCLWDWCRQPFSTAKDLSRHVLTEHVQTERWVWKSELLGLRRAEEGDGESWSVGAFVNGSLGSSAPEVKAEMDNPIPRPVEQSPRRSFSPLEAMSQNFPESSKTLNLPAQIMDLPSTPHLLKPGLRAEPGSRSPANVRTPTFASLSSPAYDMAPSPLPASPGFDSLVSDAISGRPSTWLRSSPVSVSSRGHCFNLSQDSQNSFEVVEQQLTQDPDVEPDERFDSSHSVVQTVSPSELSADGPSNGFPVLHLPDGANDSPLRSAPSDASLPSKDSLPPPPGTPQIASGVPAYHIQSPIIRQAWYQPSFPRRRDHSKTSVKSGSSSSKSGSRNSAPHSKPHKHKLLRAPAWDPPFGTPLTVQTEDVHRDSLFDHTGLAPTMHHKMGAGLDNLLDEASLSQHDGFDVWTQSPISSQAIDSPLVLQTQAPYHSQTPTQP